jgi:hypothetical protein
VALYFAALMSVGAIAGFIGCGYGVLFGFVLLWGFCVLNVLALVFCFVLGLAFVFWFVRLWVCVGLFLLYDYLASPRFCLYFLAEFFRW